MATATQAAKDKTAKDKAARDAATAATTTVATRADEATSVSDPPAAPPVRGASAPPVRGPVAPSVGARTTRVVEVESEATAAAGPHRPEPARQRFHNPGNVPVDPDAAARARKPSTYRKKVRATQDGYIYEARRRTGDVFVITSPDHFSKKWMEPVDGSVPESSTGPNKAIQEANERTKAENYAERTGERLPPTGAHRVLEEDDDDDK